MGYLAAKTKKIALGTAGIIAPLREPIHIAKAAASANVLTNNRFILGLSSGYQPVEYPAFKKDFAGRAERFREAWEMIRTLTDQDKRFAKFAGHHYGKLDGSIDMAPKMPGLDRLPMVAIGRANIIDPLFAEKILTGREDEIVPEITLDQVKKNQMTQGLIDNYSGPAAGIPLPGAENIKSLHQGYGSWGEMDYPANDELK